MDAKRLTSFFSKLSIIFVCCLPFLVPFDASRNIDAQGIILIFAGVCAWLAIGFSGPRSYLAAAKLVRSCIGLFGLFCLLSLLLNSHVSYDVLGGPYVRLGAAGLIACAGCGLLLQRVKFEHLIIGLYGSIGLIALTAIPYNLLKFHTIVRIGGIIAQADILAVLLGAGLWLGVELLAHYPKYRRQLWAYQGLLTLTLLLTQTRLVIFAVVMLGLLWLLQIGKLASWQIGVCLVSLLVLYTGLHLVAPEQRLTDPSYAYKSVTYRLRLQSDALEASRHAMVYGYGPGNVADALACPTLKGAALQATCHEHHFFNSSHDIYIDRLLAIGWLGGSSYIVFVGASLYRGWRAGPALRTTTYAASLIALYYLTNVTSVLLELLFWILLLTLWRQSTLDSQ